MPYAVIAAAAIGAGTSLYTSSQSANAAKSAANSQIGYENRALDFQEGVYNTAGQNLNPYIGAGQNALQQLLGAYGLPGGAPGGPQAAFNQFQQTQAYQFPLQQGNLALQRQLASMGLQGSGAALKDAVGYNQGYASQGYQGFLGGLSGIAGAGQNAATALGGIGNNTGTQVGSTLGAMGSASANGIVNASNASNAGINGAIGTALSGNFGNATANSPLSQIIAALGQSSYGNPSGSPSALQQAWGIGSNQYVP